MILFSFLDEIIGIDFLDLIRCDGGDADVVFDHQFGKPAAVYENDFAVDVVNVFSNSVPTLLGLSRRPAR